jgi:hypothetical protein
MFFLCATLRIPVQFFHAAPAQSQSRAHRHNYNDARIGAFAYLLDRPRARETLLICGWNVNWE